MNQRSSIVLDVAGTLPGLEEIFVENRTAINRDAITAAMLYLLEVPSSDAPNFGIDKDVAAGFYEKFEKLDTVYIRTFLKAVELEAIEKIGEYTSPLRKELNRAILAIQDVEKTHAIFYG